MDAAKRAGASLLLFDAPSTHLWTALRPRLRGGGLLACAPEATGAHAGAPEGCVDMEALLEQALAACPPLALSFAPDGLCTLVFTSGSTGPPKAVALRHGSFLAASEAKLRAVGYRPDDVYLHTAPLCHVGGLSSAHAVLCCGGCHVFPASGAFAASEALIRVQTYCATALIAVPTILTDLLAAAQAASAHTLPSVRRVLLGGGALDQPLVVAAARLFPCATITATYALSEACSSLSFRTMAVNGALTDAASDPSSSPSEGICVGSPQPGVMLRVSPSGEICARGAQMMAGYWRDDQASAAALQGSPPWLHTGDLGRLDASGALWLLGRIADVIKSGGENVHAAEVEAALATHAHVCAAAVVALPHPRWGQAVAALVTLAPGCAWHGPWAGERGAGGKERGPEGFQSALLSPEALRGHVTSQEGGLARFKAPRLVAAAGGGHLPLGATGKVDKLAVRAALAACLAQHGWPEMAHSMPTLRSRL